MITPSKRSSDPCMRARALRCRCRGPPYLSCFCGKATERGRICCGTRFARSVLPERAAGGGRLGRLRRRRDVAAERLAGEPPGERRAAAVVVRERILAPAIRAVGRAAHAHMHVVVVAVPGNELREP